MRILQCLLFVFLLVTGTNTVAGEPEAPPNVIIILADDLGFSDLGCYGGEIETPNLDSLAAGGLRFTQFYNTGRCWPTRASLLTGYYAQQVRRDKLPGVKQSGGRGIRPDWAPLLPRLLKPANYRSYHSGKWHIDSMPIREGFDRSYYLGDQARFFSPKTIYVNDQAQAAIPRGTNYYATTAIADHAIEVLKEHETDHSEKPFFQYIAFTAPHFPLHALPKDIAKYKDSYLKDWEQVRAQRWNRIQQTGIIDGQLSPVERETGAPYQRPDDVKAFGSGEVALPLAWDSLTNEQQRFQATKMAIHAAMIDRMDQEIGRIIKQLKSMNEFDNTLIFFLSDNGCSAELMIRNDGHDPNAKPGSADTHLCLGPGWSTTCNTPFRKHKTWVHEGGIATPLIAHWPKGIKTQGELRHEPGHLIDIVPTILKLAGQNHQRLDGGPIPPGKSLLSVFKNDETIERDYLWWSHDNHAAIRVDDWKAVRTKNTEWELFDLLTDRAETNDLSATENEKRQELIDLWKKTEDEFVKQVRPENPQEPDDEIARQRKKTPVEARSLLGKPLRRITFDRERYIKLDEDFKNAVKAPVEAGNIAEKLIWIGRRLGYMWRYREAIETYSSVIKMYGDLPDAYRHRGHRYITIRKLDLAIADLKKAGRLIEGTEDVVEQDGMPNESGIPTSTLHTNIWYHLGLAHYLKGDFESAIEAYEKCMAAAKNDDMRVATLDWMYMTLRRLDRPEQAVELLESVHADMEILENHAYHRRLLMYKGELNPEDLIPKEGSESYDLDLATYGYGVGNWYLVNGDVAKATETYEKVIAGKYWSAFGFIAAEADLERLRREK